MSLHVCVTEVRSRINFHGTQSILLLFHNKYGEMHKIANGFNGSVCFRHSAQRLHVKRLFGGWKIIYCNLCMHTNILVSMEKQCILYEQNAVPNDFSHIIRRCMLATFYAILL